eukprot:3124738-Prymnesium_polylepis.1
MSRTSTSRARCSNGMLQHEPKHSLRETAEPPVGANPCAASAGLASAWRSTCAQEPVLPIQLACRALYGTNLGWVVEHWRSRCPKPMDSRPVHAVHAPL